MEAGEKINQKVQVSITWEFTDPAKVAETLGVSLKELDAAVDARIDAGMKEFMEGLKAEYTSKEEGNGVVITAEVDFV